MDTTGHVGASTSLSQPPPPPQPPVAEDATCVLRGVTDAADAESASRTRTPEAASPSTGGRARTAADFLRAFCACDDDATHATYARGKYNARVFSLSFIFSFHRDPIDFGCFSFSRLVRSGIVCVQYKSVVSFAIAYRAVYAHLLIPRVGRMVLQ